MGLGVVGHEPCACDGKSAAELKQCNNRQEAGENNNTDIVVVILQGVQMQRKLAPQCSQMDDNKMYTQPILK